MSFKLKFIIAFILNLIGFTDLCLILERKKFGLNYVRIINYHDTPEMYLKNFQKQVLWIKEHYHNVDYKEFENFMYTGRLNNSNFPGIMLTFDDGFEGNCLGAEILDKNGMTGYFMISSDLVGEKGYLNIKQARKLVENNHIIGCHTATHHRMSDEDSLETLQSEIVQSKFKLENLLTTPVDIFWWCGGEEKTYTRSAEAIIEKAGYKYGFMTNSYPLTSQTDKFHIQRINVESDWPVFLMKFQICGLMDKKMKKKRGRVDKLTTL